MTENREQKTEAPGASREFTALSRRQKSPARTPDESGLRSACEDCEHSVPAGRTPAPTLICKHKADSDLPWQVVAPDDSCTNFEQSREIVPLDIDAALAEGAKLIPLSQDKFAIVDAEDYDRLNKYKWCVSKTPRTNYAMRRTKGKRVKGKRSKRKTILMHRFILNAPRGLVVDHINHNGLDNRRENLRLCTHVQNTQNRRPNRNTSSKYKGVYWHKHRNKFVAKIYMNGKRIFIGYFTDEIAAAKAYDKKAREFFKEFAYLNFPQES